MPYRAPNFALRDFAGLLFVVLIAIALVVVALITGAGPLILVALLLLLIFVLLRAFRERGREVEAKEAVKALRSRLRKGETLLATTVGDRRRVKPLATLLDFALLLFTQGLAADESGGVATDDTFVGLTNHRLIAVDRRRRPPGERRGWRERLNLRRRGPPRGKHPLVFEAPSEDLSLSLRLAVFHLARLGVSVSDGRTFSIGLNSRYWAEQAAVLTDKAVASALR